MSLGVWRRYVGIDQGRSLSLAQMWCTSISIPMVASMAMGSMLITRKSKVHVTYIFNAQSIRLINTFLKLNRIFARYVSWLILFLLSKSSCEESVASVNCITKFFCRQWDSNLFLSRPSEGRHMSYPHGYRNTWKRYLKVNVLIGLYYHTRDIQYFCPFIVKARNATLILVECITFHQTNLIGASCNFGNDNHRMRDIVGIWYVTTRNLCIVVDSTV